MAQWHVARAGKTLGIYPEDAMRAYFAQGRVAPDDFVWTHGMAQWQSAREVFGAPTNVPLPPKLHWGWVLLLTIVTAGLFYVIWSFVQAVWVRVNPKSEEVYNTPLASGFITGEALVLLFLAAASFR